MILELHSLLRSPSVLVFLSRHIIEAHLCLPCWEMMDDPCFRLQFYYPTANKVPKIDTMRMFPNRWVRTCLAFNTVSGLVQWVARGELVDNSTFSGITNNAPTDLTGKVVLVVDYNTVGESWVPSSNKLTKLEIYASALLCC